MRKMITLLDIRLDVYQPDMRLKKKLVALKLVYDSVIEVLISKKIQRTSLKVFENHCMEFHLIRTNSLGSFMVTVQYTKYS